jgi:urea transport system permease protein
VLATWGLSLILIQAVRTIFGAQNVQVENPVWMSGGIAIVLPWSGSSSSRSPPVYCCWCRCC